MDLFNYNQSDFSVSLNVPEIILVKEFKEVLDKDKTKNKAFAFKVFSFCFLYQDWKSPFIDYEQKDKLNESLISTGLEESDLEKEYISACISKYREIQENDITIAVIRDMKGSIDKFRQYFSILDFTKEVQNGARKGTMLFSPIEYLNVMKRANDIFDSIDKLEEALKKKMKENKSIRGNTEEEAIDF